MGAIKSKVFGETQFKEDEETTTINDYDNEVSINCKEPTNQQFHTKSACSLSNSNQDLPNDPAVGNNNNEQNRTILTNTASKTTSHHFPLLDLNKLEAKHQQKIRPYTLFDQSKQNTIIKENKMEPGPSVTSFQPPNHLQKSQYFRSFRMASRRLFSPNMKKLNSGLDSIENKNLNKSSEHISTLKQHHLNAATTAYNLKNNTIPANTTTAQSNLPICDKIETNINNLDTKLLDKLETNNVTNQLDFNTTLKQHKEPLRPPPPQQPNLKSKSTIDFTHQKTINSIQTSATSTKLTDSTTNHYSKTPLQNKSFRNHNFNSSSYFNSIKKRFSPQNNNINENNSVNNHQKDTIVEQDMLSTFDSRKFRSTSIIENVTGKLNHNEHLTGSSSNTSFIRSEPTVPILSFNNINNQSIRSASVSEMSKQPTSHLKTANRESVTSSSTDWEALNDNSNKNENVINDLKKQIDSLNTQLEHLGREDSKIITELSEKIENLAKMNVNIITAIGTQQENKFRSSFFGRPRQPSQTSEAYYARLKQQNEILLIQQRQIEQMRKDLLSSFVTSQATPTPQANIQQPNTSFVYPESTYYNAQQNYNGYSRPSMSSTYSNYTATSPYPNSNYFYPTTQTAPTPTMPSTPTMTSPTFSNSTAYHTHGYHNQQNSPYYMNRNGSYSADGQQYFYYPSAHHFHQPQPQPQRIVNNVANPNIYYDPNSGQYFQYQTRAPTVTQAQYFYNQNLNGIYANIYAYRKAQASAHMNEHQFDQTYDQSKQSDAANVIITEVNTDDEDSDEISSKYNSKKDYVDAISLNDEEI